MESLSGEYKFNNCTYRSEEEETLTVYRCKCQGGDYRDSGYKCKKRNIFKIIPAVCEHCPLYSAKLAV